MTKNLKKALQEIRSATGAEQVDSEDWGLLTAIVKESTELLNQLMAETSKASCECAPSEHPF